MIRGLTNMLASSQSLEQFVSDTLQWKKHNWAAFITHWKYKDVCKMLLKYRAQVDAVLGTLDPRDHAIAYSYLLGFKSTEKLEEPQAILLYLRQIDAFIGKADRKQLVLCPRPFTDALRYFVDYYKRENKVALIPQLHRCIHLLQGGSSDMFEVDTNVNLSILTFAHCELMSCCVDTYRYDLAFPVIEQNIIEVQGAGCVKAIDNLRYHFCAAMVFIALKDYARAMEFLTMVCTAPSEAISLIQIEAYKKYILVSLIRKQSLVSLPRYCPRILTRYFPKFCAEYIDISNAFSTGVARVSQTVERNLEVYRQDYNFGLVKQVLRSCEKNAVRKLTSVYTRLSSEKVAELCQFESPVQAKRVVLSMIRNRELSATFDAEGVITFSEAVTQSDRDMMLQVQNRIETTLKLYNGLDRAQLKVKQSQQWISKTLSLPSFSDEAQQMQMISNAAFFGR